MEICIQGPWLAEQTQRFRIVENVPQKYSAPSMEVVTPLGLVSPAKYSRNRATGLLGLVPKVTSRRQWVLVITDKCNSISRATPSWSLPVHMLPPSSFAAGKLPRASQHICVPLFWHTSSWTSLQRLGDSWLSHVWIQLPTAMKPYIRTIHSIWRWSPGFIAWLNTQWINCRETSHWLRMWPPSATFDRNDPI